MKYQHFTIEEREKIQEMLWHKVSIRVIAKALGRSPSSVSREINKNIPIGIRKYTPRLAHGRALKQRKSRGRKDRLKSQELRAYVVSQLKLGWSPEQISATAQKAVGLSISHEAIYQYIYSQIRGYGYVVKTGREDLRPYLARRRTRRMRRGARKPYRIEKGPLPSIDNRPIEVEARIVPGHWEDDCIVSRASLDRLKTINERATGLVFIAKVKNGTAAETNRVVADRLKAIPKQFRKTLTRDRGAENMGYTNLENSLSVKCYFAHAYHSWERGSNENLNGLIRRYFPKKTDFRTITAEEIQLVEYLLNSRPRKRLGWKTPYEVFYELTGVALQC
ncbi:MAG: Integrase core domain protein [Parcubacteria group bacterium ADurb.Bin316]|nr:MAG: Integrase core domain protein [Parcubacteria group bacterium ADurb.Bin316]